MKLSSRPHVASRIAAFSVAKAKAAEKGLVVLPSVSGPYVFNPSTNAVVGRAGSAEYRAATT